MWNGPCPQNPEYNVWANQLNGSEGMQFQPGITAGENVSGFTIDLARSGMLYQNGTATIKGIHTWRYEYTKSYLQNKSQYPPNCAFDGDGPSGTINMTRYERAPAFVSEPFFNGADPVYRAAVDGLAEPNAKKHESYLMVEPWTGGSWQWWWAWPCPRPRTHLRGRRSVH